MGSGFGGLATAALLGKAGYQVLVLEKNEIIGGRAGVLEASIAIDSVNETHLDQKSATTSEPRTGTIDKTNDSVHEQLMEPLEPLTKATAKSSADDDTKESTSSIATNSTSQGMFKFDTGPCWYIMPEIFEHFFTLLDERIDDHVELIKLTPSYRAFYEGHGLMVEMFSDLERDLPTIEGLEPRTAKAFKRYIAQSDRQYSLMRHRFLYKNHDSALSHLKPDTVMFGQKLRPFTSANAYTGEFFKSDTLRKLIQYPAIFMGINPYSTPAVYNILSHGNFTAGAYYPKGGIYSLVEALRNIGKKHNVEYQLNNPVGHIIVEQGRAVGVRLENGEQLRADIIISNADINHTEQALLDPQYRTKTEAYWRRRTLAPSALVMHLGVKGNLPNLSHHNLLFAKHWQRNFIEIFNYPQWPADPSLYICNPSKTDPSVAPVGYENLSVIVPIAASLDYSQRTLDAYANKVLAHIEQAMKLEDLRERIVFKKLFCAKDFEERYNSFGGSAFGLAHTVRQNNLFGLPNINRKVANLYYVGADASPGIGLAGTLASAELLFKRLIQDTRATPLKPEQIK